MRVLMITVAFALAGGSAMATSIETIRGTHTGNGSIKSVTCAQCPALKKNERQQEYSVPRLASGPVANEILDVDGKPELFRTDALLGGSPVVYISKNATWLPIEGSSAVASAPADTVPDDGVDVSATTSAVIGIEPPLQASAVSAEPKAEPDFSHFTLRSQ